MTTVLFASGLQYFFGITMFLVALFLIMLVLVQRGKGGGLAGAFGGMGGQSAFGTKAGDTFTKITIYLATFWIILCVVAVKVFSDRPTSNNSLSTISSPKSPSDDNPLTNPNDNESNPLGQATDTQESDTETPDKETEPGTPE